MKSMTWIAGQAARLGCIFALLPLGIAGDRIDRHLPHHAVAPGDLDRQAGERHQGVHEIGIGVAPDPGVHAAHRGAHHQTEVIDLQALGEQVVLGAHHVVVVVLREAHVEPVARAARFAVADPVGEDDEVFRRVEELPGAEELAGERGHGGSPCHRRSCRAGSARRCAPPRPHPGRACRESCSGCAARAASRRSRNGNRGACSSPRPEPGSARRAPGRRRGGAGRGRGEGRIS